MREVRLALALLLVMTVGMATENYTMCLDNVNELYGFKLDRSDGNSTWLNYSHACDYGCDFSTNQCREPPITSMPMMIVIMLVFFFINIGVLLLKLYNLMSGGKLYDKRITVMTLVIALLSWLFIFGITLVNIPITVWSTGYAFDLMILNFTTVMLLLTGLFTVAELLMQHTIQIEESKIGLRRKGGFD